MPAAHETERRRDRRVRALQLIAESITVKGYPPSVSELAAATGVSKRSAAVDLQALEADGAIKRDPSVARGIRLTLPDA